ncbi:unnamed protein product, partial [Ostreobium quekettii]
MEDVVEAGGLLGGPADEPETPQVSDKIKLTAVKEQLELKGEGRKGTKRLKAEKKKTRGKEKIVEKLPSIPPPMVEQEFEGSGQGVLAGKSLVDFVNAEIGLQYGSGTLEDQERYCQILRSAVARIDNVPVGSINHRPPTALTTRPFLLDRRAQLIENFNFDHLGTAVIVVEDRVEAENERLAPVAAREWGANAKVAWAKYDLRPLLEGLIPVQQGEANVFAFTLIGNHSTAALAHFLHSKKVQEVRAVRPSYNFFRSQFPDELFQFLSRYENEACAAEAQLTAGYNLFSDPRYLCPFIRKHWKDLGSPGRSSEEFAKRMNAVLETRAETEQQKAAVKAFQIAKHEEYKKYTALLENLEAEMPFMNPALFNQRKQNLEENYRKARVKVEADHKKTLVRGPMHHYSSEVGLALLDEPVYNFWLAIFEKMESRGLGGFTTKKGKPGEVT